MTDTYEVWHNRVSVCRESPPSQLIACFTEASLLYRNGGMTLMIIDSVLQTPMTSLMRLIVAITSGIKIVSRFIYKYRL